MSAPTYMRTNAIASLVFSAKIKTFSSQHHGTRRLRARRFQKILGGSIAGHLLVSLQLQCCEVHRLEAKEEGRLDADASLSKLNYGTSPT